MIKKVKEITDYLGWLDAFICDEQLSVVQRWKQMSWTKKTRKTT